ncbi:MAG: type II toxin-antitoxin system VapC family toxin [Gemmatimonadaceae bacterium]
MIVVDANVVAYLLLPGEHTTTAREALKRDAAWAAPLLWRSEFRNVLALYLRQRYLTLEEALDVQGAAEELLTGREFTVESAPVLQLVAESGRSAYDCEFVALATLLDLPFVTSDRQLLSSFPETAISLAEFCSGDVGA